MESKTKKTILKQSGRRGEGRDEKRKNDKINGTRQEKNEIKQGKSRNEEKKREVD